MSADRLTGAQKKDIAAYDKALMLFRNSMPHLNTNEIDALVQSPRKITEFRSDNINNANNLFRITVIAGAKEQEDQSEPKLVTYEANRMTLDRQESQGRIFWDKKTDTYYVSMIGNNIQSIKYGHHFTVLRETEKSETTEAFRVTQLLDPEKPIVPAEDIATLEDMGRKTEALNTIAGWFTPKQSA